MNNLPLWSTQIDKATVLANNFIIVTRLSVRLEFGHLKHIDYFAPSCLSTYPWGIVVYVQDDVYVGMIVCKVLSSDCKYYVCPM